MLKKKELLEAIKTKDHETLIASLLQHFFVQVEMYHNFMQDYEGSVWVGDYLYHLCLKGQIDTDDLMYLFMLTNEKGMRWIDYLGHKTSSTSLAFCRLLQALFNKNKLSLSNINELLFSPAQDGWTLAASLAKYQPSCQDFLLHFLDHFAKNNKGNDTLDIFYYTIDDDWMFLKILAHYQGDSVFSVYLRHFKDWIEKGFILPSEGLALLAQTTKSGRNTIDHLFLDAPKLQSLKEVLKILTFIYKQDPTQVTNIINLLKHVDGLGCSLLYRMLVFEQLALSLEEFFKALKQDELSLILSVFIDSENVDKNLFHKMAQKEYSWLSNLNTALLEMCKNGLVIHKNYQTDDALISQLCTILFKPNRKGHHYLHLLFNEGRNSKQTDILLAVLKNLTHHIETIPIVVSGLFDETPEGWNVFHLAARYQSEAINIELITLIEELLQHNEIFSKPIERLLTAESELYYLQLLSSRQKETVVEKLFNAVRKLVLNDRKLSLNMLMGLLKCLKQSKQTLTAMRNFVTEILEKNTLSYLDSLEPTEKECLDGYVKIGFPAANYLLYRYHLLHPELKNKVDYLQKAYEGGYDLASIIKCVAELKHLSLKNNHDKIFSKYEFDLSNPESLITLLNKKRDLIYNEDYIYILEQATKVFKNLDLLFYTIGSFYYDTTNLKLAKENYDKIPVEKPTALDQDCHYQLSLAYLHFTDTLGLVRNLYLSHRHYQFALLKGYDTSQDSQGECLKDAINGLPFLGAFLELEDIFRKTSDKVLNVVTQHILKDILKTSDPDKNTQNRILSLCTMVTKWLKNPDLTCIEKEFAEFKNLYKSESTPSLFQFFKPNELLDAVSALYFRIRDNLVKNSTELTKEEIKNA